MWEQWASPTARGQDGRDWVGRGLTRLQILVRTHWMLFVVLGAGVLLRIATEIAYHPALFYADSWEYLGLGLQHPFVGFEVDRPSGYPLLIWLFTLSNRSLILLTGVQHLAGLAAAAIVYAIAVTLRLPRWVAALAAAFLALDGAWVALEQFVMADTFFMLCVVGAVLAAVVGDVRAPRHWAISGLLIAVATTMRTAGLFLMVPWLAYLLLRRGGWRASGVAIAALATPLLAYSVLHAADGRGFGMTQAGGWFLYGRVAPIARCTSTWPTARELRAVCPTPTELANDWSPSDYLWDASSPPNRIYTSMYVGNVAHSSAVLNTFARQAIKRRPGAVVSMLWHASLAVFRPSGGGWETSEEFPGPHSTDWVDPVVKREFERNYHRRVDFPQAQLRAYWKLLHTPRLLMGLLSVLALLLVLPAAVSRRWRQCVMAPEIILLTGGGLALTVGAISTSDLNVRYAMPAEPLLVLGAAVAVAGAVRAVRTWRTMRSRDQEPAIASGRDAAEPAVSRH
jgi:hypothetical protein